MFVVKPKAILRHVQEGEEILWIKNDLNTIDGAQANDPATILVRKSQLVQQIHQYFGSLEPRKCCLALSGCKTSFSNVRLVRNDGRDSGIEEGAMIRSPVDVTETFKELNAQAKRVFMRAYLCASYPVLCAPEPPSPLSPPPVPSQSSKKFQFAGQLTIVRPPTPDDSGLEEDMSVVPADTLFELLRRTFHLSQDKFHQYEHQIYRQHQKKEPSKILAEELVGQLALLENDLNPYYNPEAFMSPLGYESWKRKEFSHIAELLKKFWHTAYPPLSNNYKQNQRGILEDYKILLFKVLRYESPYRVEGDLLAPGLSCLLSSASVRLLREFGLRYGIRDVYRKLVYLQYLTGHFVPSAWFIQHACSTLSSVLDLLPASGASNILLKEEYDILKKSLEAIEKLCHSNICKMKSLFPNNIPSDGLDSLIYLVTLTRRGCEYLRDKKVSSVEVFLKNCVQSIFPVCYEEHKIVAIKDLHQKGIGLSPTLMNKMICKMRDEVKDYRDHYQETFEKYFNITLMAAQSLYHLLMRDVEKVCQNQPRTGDIDKCMLGLAYRLDQLDRSWVAFISEEQQTWRTWFEKMQVHWIEFLTLKLNKFMQEAVSKDKFRRAIVDNIDNIIETPSSSLLGHRIRSVSSKSITPSLNSAFSGLMSSSLHSTPLHSHYTPVQRQDTKEKHSHSKQIKDSSSGRSGAWFSKMHVSSSAPGPFGDTQSLCEFSEEEEEGGVMTFSNLRHSSSVPEMLSKSYDHHLDVPRPGLKFPNLKSDGNGSEDFKKLLKINSSVRTPPAGNFDTCDNRELSDHLKSSADDEIVDIIQGDLKKETNNKLDREFKPEETSDWHEHQPTEKSAGNETELTPTNDCHQQLLSENAMPVGDSYHGDGGDQDSLAGEFTQSLEEGEGREGDQESMSSTQDSPGQNFDFPPMVEVVTLDSEKLIENEPTQKAERQHVHEQREVLLSTKENKDPGSSSEVDSSSPENQTSSSDNQVPLSPLKKAYIPVSSSLFDVLILLQRTIGFSKTLCQTFYKSSHRTSDFESSFSSSTTTSSCYSGEIRRKLYTRFNEVVCSLLMDYADNILCLDLCGTTCNEGIRLVGTELVRHLQKYKQSGKVWGCRHQIGGVRDCFQYVNRRTDMLCDRYEPITQAMCVRMNIVSSLLSFHEVFHKKLASVFNYEWSQVSPAEFYDLPEGTCENSMEACKIHFQAVVRSLARLMAYRLNLFVYNAMTMFLGQRDARRNVTQSLAPLTQFLSSYIDLLNQWLYLDNFHIVMENLWIFIVQNFEKEVIKLAHSENSLEEARQLVQAFTILLKLMSSKDTGIHRNLLLSQAEPVMFKLQIYTTASHQLIQLYEKLTEHYYGSDTVSICTIDGTVKTILHRIREDLLIYRKCFSGSHLVTWITHHPELFYQFDPDLENTSSSKEKRWTAISIAESLLRAGVIVDMDASDETDSEEEDDSTDFPEISIAGGNGTSFPCDGNFSAYNTPRATPVSHPDQDEHQKQMSSKKRSHYLSLHSHLRGTPILQHCPRPQDPHSSPMIHHSLPVKQSETVTPVEESIQSENVRSTLHQSHRAHVLNSPVKLTQSLKGQRNPVLPAPQTCKGSELLNSQREQTVRECDIQEDRPCTSGEAKTNPGSTPETQNVLDYRDIKGWHFPYCATPNLNESVLNSSFQDSEFLFEDSRRKYYRIASFADSLNPNSSPSSEELNNLVEKCFETKIAPDFVFRILLSRRKFEDVAQNYVDKHTQGEMRDLSCEVS
ncbi:uncharacterized protein LOC134283874 [Saccostrea cucullata]|uniref:uncharacterized protein LOC134283874 n=1 Tax=Saccostrea cuccullata TaxID=36930 RepID=UPI002ED0D67E